MKFEPRSKIEQKNHSTNNLQDRWIVNSPPKKLKPQTSESEHTQADMHAVAKRAAPLAVGVGTAAVSLASSTAECRSAVVVTKEQLEEACSLIKDDMADSQDFDLLELSASVAADPTVQRVLQEKYEQHGLSSLRSRLPALSTRTLGRPFRFSPHPTTYPPQKLRPCTAQHPILAQLVPVLACLLAAS